MKQFEYVPASTPDDCILKISPSSFGNFVEKVHYWFQTQVAKENVFDYNSMSTIGTIVHSVAEQVAKGEDVDESAIAAFIASKAVKDDYDPERVHYSWYEMASVLVNGYVLKNVNDYIAIEQQFCAPVGNGVYAAGTLDALQGTKEDCMIVDYKTYSSKTKPKAITAHYRYQLLVYAWVLRSLGYNVTRIRLVYVNERIDGGVSDKTGKPLKSYPPELTVLTESVEDESFEFIKSMLELCRDTYLAYKSHPELAHVIYHDPRLKAE